MKLLTSSTDYDETIQIAQKLNDTYSKSVTFHAYWNGELNEKHLYSILSCYYFNVYKNKHKIVLWIENNNPNKYNIEIAKYAEIKIFNYDNEIKSLSDQNIYFVHNKRDLTEYADFIRLLLLYNYSNSVWFDLDVFFLRNFDPLFYKFEDDICVYQWENQNYPNNAIIIGLNSLKLKSIINFFQKQKKGWGFQQTYCTYDSPIDILVLPCSWFDSSWIQNPLNLDFNTFFNETDKIYNFDNFFKGAFCYHWHNKWKKPIHENSIIMQLINIIKKNMECNQFGGNKYILTKLKGGSIDKVSVINFVE